jgi:hypothetical protein
MEMVKLLGQSLALIAMTASVINAQCAVSCALQSNAAGSPAQHVIRVDPDRAGHACCRHQSVPKPKRHKDEVPCSHPVPAAAARHNTSIAIFSTIPSAVIVDLNHQYCLHSAEKYLDPLVAPDSSGQGHLSSIFILRV